MRKMNAEDLLRKYRSGQKLTAEEQTVLESWYLHLAKISPGVEQSAEEFGHNLINVQKDSAVNFPIRKLNQNRFLQISLIAASILIFTSVALFFYNQKSDLKLKTAKVINNEVAPGDKKAVLTLSDNTQIVLDSASLGAIANQSGITIRKTASGQLEYIIGDKNLPANAPVQYNTISTPRGGEYKIQLSDGTTVWLNALSSIRFPTTFKGDERRVEISGEAYFEVAKNAKMPFRAVSVGQIVEVLGTRFNINTYSDEQTIKTTLIEGSIKLTQQVGNASVILKPGEQASIRQKDNQFAIDKIDTEETIAWKNGYFIFVNEDLESVMRKISRWYNVEVEFKGTNKQLKMGGAISRNRNLSDVLALFELTDNLKFKVEGRRVTIMR